MTTPLTGSKTEYPPLPSSTVRNSDSGIRKHKNKGYGASDTKSKITDKKAQEIITEQSSKDLPIAKSALNKKGSSKQALTKKVTILDEYEANKSTDSLKKSSPTKKPYSVISKMAEIIDEIILKDDVCKANALVNGPRDDLVKFVRDKLNDTLKEELPKTNEEELESKIRKKMEVAFGKQSTELKNKIKNLESDLSKAEETIATQSLEKDDALKRVKELTSTSENKTDELFETKKNLQNIAQVIRLLSTQFQSLIPNDPNAEVAKELRVNASINIVKTLNSACDLVNLPHIDTSVNLVEKQSESVKIPSHEEVMALGNMVSTLHTEVKSECQKLISSDSRNQSNIQATFGKFIDQLLVHSKTASELKLKLQNELIELQKNITEDETPYFSEDILNGIAKVTLYTKPQLEANIEAHNAKRNSQLDELEDIVTKFSLINDILNEVAYKVRVSLSEPADIDLIEKIEIVTTNLKSSFIPFADVTIIPIKVKLIESALSDFREKSNAYHTTLRDRRKEFDTYKAPTEEPYKSNHIEMIKNRYLIDKAELLEYNRKWPPIRDNVLTLINDLRNLVTEGEKSPKIPSQYVNRVALIQGETPIDLTEKNTNFAEAHRKRQVKLTQLVSAFNKIYENMKKAKKEVNRSYTASLDLNGEYSSETYYNLRGQVDPEVEKTFIQDVTPTA
ncbi:MAG: hypothetical protein VX777_05870 [Chlamydiota bacterium]|nr:hypothetical protein [Chlamydiota bacterium]